MPVIMRAAVELQAGCLLQYRCPLWGDDYSSQEFFDKYRGKFATFIEHGEKAVAPLDYAGRVPGQYLDHDHIVVRFNESGETFKKRTDHFVIVDPEDRYTRFTALPKRDQRLGDLTYPILFYPDDVVRFKNKPQSRLANPPRRVESLFLDDDRFVLGDKLPRYQVIETPQEYKRRITKLRKQNEELPDDRRPMFPNYDIERWNTAGDDLKLVRRGNVWALYNQPQSLVFESPEAESVFWGRSGISYGIAIEQTASPRKAAYQTTSRMGVFLEDAWELFLSGEIDALNPTHDLKGKGEPETYRMRKLFECWDDYRAHVRDLTRQLFEHQLKEHAG